MSKNRSGNAYVYVLITGLLLFMLVGAALAVTGQSRRVSAAYPAYAGLYDMAVAGNERVLFLLQDRLREQYPALDAAVREQIKSGPLAEHLAYKDGAFHLRAPVDGYYESLYRAAARTAVTQYLSDTTGRSIGPWRWEQRLAVTFPVQTTGEAEAARFDESYLLVTELDAQGDGYVVKTAAYKTINGVIGYPVTVEALINWRKTAHEELYLPVFTWRNGPGFYFSGCLYPDNAPDAAFDLPRLDALAAHEDEALVITAAPALDVSAWYEGETPGLVFVVHTGGGALRLYTSDPDKNALGGIVCGFGAVTLEAVRLTGTVIAADEIRTVGACTLTPGETMPFDIPLSVAARRDVLDFLRLTRFHQSSGVVTDMTGLLGAVDFDFSEENGGEIVVNNFDGASLAMVKSKKIAD